VGSPYFTQRAAAASAVTPSKRLASSTKNVVVDHHAFQRCRLGGGCHFRSGGNRGKRQRPHLHDRKGVGHVRLESNEFGAPQCAEVRRNQFAVVDGTAEIEPVGLAEADRPARQFFS
jgi:hypothetical protein